MRIIGGIRRTVTSAWRLVMPTYWYGFHRLRPGEMDFLKQLHQPTHVTNEVAPEHVGITDTDIASDPLVAQQAQALPLAPRWRPPSTAIRNTAIPRLSLRTVWTACKDPQHPDSNEDAAEWIPELQRAAVFDGATESFAAKRWVALVREAWSPPDPVDLTELQERYAADVAGMDLSWAQHEASQRGSFTTIASIEPAPGGLKATCIGDSAIVLLREGDIVDAFPSPDPAHYSSVPDALGSSADHLTYGRELLEACNWTIPLEAGVVDTVVLATDAVAVWLLSGDASVRQERFASIHACDSTESWEALVHSERAHGHMKTDDSTVMVIDVRGAS